MQELMAARALTGAKPEKVEKHLRATARSPHWRNTWLFAAGRLFTEDDYKKDLVLDIVENVDLEPGGPGWLYPAAPELAAHLREDGLSANKPAWERRLLDCTLRILQGPMPEDPRAIGIGLTEAAQTPVYLLRIRNAFLKAFAGEPQSRAIARIIKSFADLGSTIPGELNSISTQASNPTPVDSISNTPDFLPEVRPELIELLDGSQRETLAKAIEEIASIILHMKRSKAFVLAESPNGSEIPATLSLMKDPELCDVFAMYLDGLDPAIWVVRASLALRVAAQTSRYPVGHAFEFEYLPKT